MAHLIRLTESDLHNIVKMTVRNVLREMGGDGATSTGGVMQAGGGNPEAGQYTVPFGKVQRRKGYSAKGSAGGDVTKQDSNVDMSPALKRNKDEKNGSISMNHV